MFVLTLIDPIRSIDLVLSSTIFSIYILPKHHTNKDHSISSKYPYLHAGKTTLSRGFIREKFEENTMVITSPSYLLDNTYEYGEGKTIHHMDLYRLPTGCDMSMLGIPSIFSNSLCLIEWPQRMGSESMPDEYLDVEMLIAEDEVRNIKLMPSSPSSTWGQRLQNIFR
tara:strand:+ start:142 stop:645 length:504 start_codon:yes stop_codon:yes gene_type:complete